MKKIAVITRTKNRPQLLLRCAENLSQQTTKDFQWIIVNDAGDKDKVEKVTIHARKLGLDVVLLHRIESTGIAAAANYGIDNSKSELIHIHDDDDSVEFNFYELMSQLLDSKKYYGGAVCSTSKIIENLTPTEIIFIKKINLFDSNMATHIADLLVKNQFSTISFVFRRSAFDAVGHYDNSLPVLEDWDFNLRFIELYDIGAIDSFLANYHHRIPNKNEITPQTITNGSNLHEEFSAIIRNRYIRTANTEKKIALALIMANGRYHQLVTNRLKTLDDYVRSTNLIGDLAKRVIKKFR